MMRFEIYNIQNSRNGGIKSELRGMEQANLELGVFQYTKVMDNVYTQALEEYHVIASEVPNRHRGRVIILYWDVPHFQVEAIQLHGLNLTRFQLASGGRGWFILRCYIYPDNVATIKRVVASLGQ